MTHPHFFIHVLVRWLEFVSLVGVFGGLVYRYFVASAIRRETPRFVERSFRRSMLIAVLVLAAADITDLVFRSLMITGRPVEQLWAVLPAVLLKTHFGRVWIWQFLLVLILTGLLLMKRTQDPEKQGRRFLFMGTAMGICLTTSLSGHAADLGSVRLTVLLDWIHVMAVSIWVGGLFALRMHLRPAVVGVPEAERREFLAAAIRSFSTVAMTAVGTMLLTGIYNTWVHVHSPSLLAGTDYGRILMLKWLFIVPMVSLGGINRFYFLPRLENRGGLPARMMIAVMDRFFGRPADQYLGRLFFRLITIEALLGLGVLACSAWITQLPPPHEPSVGFEHGGHAM